MKQFQVCKRLRARYDILTILFLFLSMLFQGIQCADTPALVLQRKPPRQDVVNFSPSEGKWATRVRCLGVAFAPRSPDWALGTSIISNDTSHCPESSQVDHPITYHLPPP
jgi:hypothetical protein